MTPVDPVALNCPNYYDIIKQPVDLSTIQSKFDNHEYKSEKEFEHDMQLMFENCFNFNGTDHQIAPFCQTFKETFNARFASIKKAQEKSKFTLLDKIRQMKGTVKQDIAKHKNIILDLEAKLEGLEQQEKEEEQKLKESEVENMPKQKPQKTVKPKSKPIKPTTEVVVKKAKKKPPKEDEKRKRPRKFRPPQRTLPPPPEQPVEIEQRVKSDSEEDDSAPSMTYEEMRSLSMAINALPSDRIVDVLGILKKYQPKEATAQGDELVIEVQNLKPVTLRALAKYIADSKKPKPGKVH